MRSNVVQLQYTAATFRKRVAELAQDSANVAVKPHAKSRMRQRKITLAQVLDVLRRGHIVEPPHPNTHGNWRATFAKIVAGDNIHVVAALERLESGELVIVVTVY